MAAALALSGIAWAVAQHKPGPAKAMPGTMRSWRLAFVRDGDIWVAEGDGTGQQMVIKDGYSPAWSPDKKQIAFARRANVWLANADGSGQRQLTRAWKATEREPWELEKAIDISWEPTNALITFSHEDEYRLLRVRDGQAATTDTTSIYTVPSHDATPDSLETFLQPAENSPPRFGFLRQDHPAWSRSGRRMAFARNGDIWLAERGQPLSEPDWSWVHLTLSAWGWEIRRVAAVAQYDAPTARADSENHAATHFSWSPDEKLLAYEYQRVGGSGFEEIHILNLKIGKHWRLPDSQAYVALRPSFSPDGKWIAYLRSDPKLGEEFQQGIWICRLHGSGKRLLIANADDLAW